uniref:WW domain binding protein VOPP1 n=1 Tax=Cyprinus carpio carpio TaxID=630221 RepID=A0A8C1E966_CYPCA
MRERVKRHGAAVLLTLCAVLECIEAKKYCWYFEGGYPIYFICRSYEECCGTRCCVRALSIQRLWYFWLLLMMGVLFCCGAGFFIRRRMYPSALSEEPAFNVSFTRHPVSSPVWVLFYSPELVVEEVFKSHPLQGVKASCETVRCQTSASGFGVTWMISWLC